MSTTLCRAIFTGFSFLSKTTFSFLNFELLVSQAGLLGCLAECPLVKTTGKGRRTIWMGLSRSIMRKQITQLFCQRPLATYLHSTLNAVKRIGVEFNNNVIWSKRLQETCCRMYRCFTTTRRDQTQLTRWKSGRRCVKTAELAHLEARRRSVKPTAIGLVQCKHAASQRDWDDWLFMAALCNRGALYFCPVVSSFLPSSFYFFPRLISAAVDWMSAILLHMAWP